MTLLDTNVIIYAFELESPFHKWSVRMIADSVAGDGGAINAVSLAEVCVGEEEPESVADRIRSWGVDILNVPVAAAPVCACAFRLYGTRRPSGFGERVSRMPLPDFFIGAHAQIMKWDLVTADADRFRTYFPSVHLITP